MRVLAIDFGRKRMGVAVSDEGGSLARPLKTIAVPRNGMPMAELGRLVAEFGPGRIVLGLPRRLDGSPGSLESEVAGFAETIRSEFGLPVVLWDERLTTHAASEKLIEAGVSRKRRRESLDQAAAAVILQDYLDTERPGA